MGPEAKCYITQSTDASLDYVVQNIEPKKPDKQQGIQLELGIEHQLKGY